MTSKQKQPKPLQPMKAWCVCHLNGKPLLWSGYMPVFWLRKVAVREAHQHGWKDGEFTVRRIAIAEAAK